MQHAITIDRCSISTLYYNPNWIVMANSTNTFKSRLDIQYWQDQEIIYDFRAQLQGTGSHSDIFRQDHKKTFNF